MHFEDYASNIYTRPLGKHVADCVDSIERALRGQDLPIANSALDTLLGLVQSEVGEASAYVMVVSPAVGRMLKCILENQESIDEGEFEWRRLFGQDQSNLVIKFLQLLGQLSYRELREDYFLKLLSSFWLIFTCDDIDIYEGQHHHIFDLTLQTIKRMLSSNNRIVLSHLKSMGLGLQLTKILQFDEHYLTLQNQVDLMEIVENYVSLESRFNGKDYFDKINGKAMLEMEQAEKLILAAACLSSIDSKYEDTYYSALSALITIFERHQNIIDSISKHVHQITELIKSPLPHVQLKALELTDDLIFHDSSIAADLLRHSYLPDLLLNVLRQHRREPTPHTHSLCCIASNVLSNLTLTNNKQQQQQLADHPIWELAYENIQMGSPLLPLVSAFEYFLEMLPRKTAINFLESYLSSVGSLDAAFLERREMEAIKRTIQRVYITCLDFWPKEYEYRFRSMIKSNQLESTLEDLMDVEGEEQSPL